jgi:hypothetical protein
MLCLILTGCESGKGWFGSGKSDVLIAPPSNWQTLEGQTITAEGSAGNSPSGPILRFRDGSWIGITGIPKWGFDAVTKPIGVIGVVAPGTGSRDGEYVIVMKQWYLQGQSAIPPKP